jgi:hypothetical protein
MPRYVYEVVLPNLGAAEFAKATEVDRESAIALNAAHVAESGLRGPSVLVPAGVGCHDKRILTFRSFDFFIA